MYIHTIFHEHILTDIEYTWEAVAKELNWSRMFLLQATQRSTNWTGLEPFLERLFGLSCPHQHGSSESGITMCLSHGTKIFVNLLMTFYDYDHECILMPLLFFVAIVHVSTWL